VQIQRLPFGRVQADFEGVELEGCTHRSGHNSSASLAVRQFSIENVADGLRCDLAGQARADAGIEHGVQFPPRLVGLGIAGEQPLQRVLFDGLALQGGIRQMPAFWRSQSVFHAQVKISGSNDWATASNSGGGTAFPATL